MPSLAERVATRYAGSRRAGFIPDTFFTGYEAQLKKLFATRLGSNPLREAASLIEHEMLPLLQRFVDELSELAPSARVTLKDRLTSKKAQLEKLAASLDASDRAHGFPHPQTSTRDRILLHIHTQVSSRLEKLLPTLGKALQTSVHIDPEKVQALATKADKKMPPDVRAAVDRDDFNNADLELKYGFYRANVDGSIPRLIQKEKIEIAWLDWFAFIRNVLLTNYANPETFTEFDLNGMKVVINDATVDASDTERYVKYLDKAYHLLKAKKLSRAWYGTVYIECAECGGVNHLTGGGVGGHYNIERDHVKVFSRPSSFIVELMAHELGHRYWYKSLSSTQREKFTALVKVRTRPKPNMTGFKPNLQGPEVIVAAMKRVDEAAEQLRGEVRAFDKSRIKWFGKVIDQFEAPLAKAALAFRDALFTGVQNAGGPSSSPEAKAAWQELQAAENDVFKHLFNFRDLSSRVNRHPDGSDWNVVFKTEKSHWIAECEDFLNVLRSVAERYVTACIEGYNRRQETLSDDLVKEWQAEQDAIVKPVLPVSGYGSSNISEAFAEVFAYYVLDIKMDADQEASFRSVLLDQDRTASRVARRWSTYRSSFMGRAALERPQGGGPPHHVS